MGSIVHWTAFAADGAAGPARDAGARRDPDLGATVRANVALVMVASRSAEPSAVIEVGNGR